MQNLFDVAFNVFMILFPAVFALCIRVKPDERGEEPARPARIAILRRRLFAGTALVLLAFWLLYCYISTEVASYMWICSFLLWFHLAMPLLQAKDPGWRPLQRPQTVRGASLTRRDTPGPALRFGWLAAWLLWLIVLVATFAGLVRGGSAAAWWMLLFTATGSCYLIGGPWALKQSLLEPEPMDAQASPELLAAWARLRRLKLLAWFGLAVGAMLVFSLPPLVIAWGGQAWLMAAIVIGAGGGALIGVLGGVFGVAADLQRTRINRLYRALTREAAHG